jgi:hypothetical protein
MAASGKKKTTMAKLARESRLRERRLEKQAKKDARKQAPAPHPEWPGDTLNATAEESAQTDTGQSTPSIAGARTAPPSSSIGPPLTPPARYSG